MQLGLGEVVQIVFREGEEEQNGVVGYGLIVKDPGPTALPGSFGLPSDLPNAARALNHGPRAGVLNESGLQEAVLFVGEELGKAFGEDGVSLKTMSKDTPLAYS